jgi:hypothetical protein
MKISYFIEMPNDICAGPFETANKAAAWIAAQQPAQYMRQNGGWRIKPLCDPNDPDWKIAIV